MNDKFVTKVGIVESSERPLDLIPDEGTIPIRSSPKR